MRGVLPQHRKELGHSDLKWRVIRGSYLKTNIVPDDEYNYSNYYNVPHTSSSEPSIQCKKAGKNVGNETKSVFLGSSALSLSIVTRSDIPRSLILLDSSYTPVPRSVSMYCLEISR